jgi:hypothetical protein
MCTEIVFTGHIRPWRGELRGFFGSCFLALYDAVQEGLIRRS